MTITSPDNEKLKLVRALAERRRRDREGLFVTEGEDLVEAGLGHGAEPELLLIEPGYSGPGEGLGLEVERALLDRVSALGSGTRVIGVWAQRWSGPLGPVCLYLDGIGDPGNVGAILRTHAALVEGSVVIGPGCADPYSPKAVRAAMGAIFDRPPSSGPIAEAPSPRIGLAAHGGQWPVRLPGGPADRPGATGPEGPLPRPPVTLCLGSEREGLSAGVLAACDATATIPARPGGAESLNVAAAAAICCERVSSLAVPEASEDAARPGRPG